MADFVTRVDLKCVGTEPRASTRRADAQPLAIRCLKIAGFRHGLGKYLQFEDAVGTVPARLPAASVSGCGARCERPILAVCSGVL